MIQRCDWVKKPIEESYHDNEWGKVCHEDRKLFELLILEGMQAGLSWLTILNKRAAFNRAFDAFDYQKVAQYDQKKIQQLLQDPTIIRHRLKIEAAVNNAQCFIKLRLKYGSFDAYIWSFLPQGPIINHWLTTAEVPAKTPLSEQISRELKKAGFKFVGPTIVYSYMQAIGMINDHVESCSFK